MNERDTEIAKYEMEFWSLIETNFDCRLEGMSTSASSYLKGPITFNARFPTKNSYLIGSPYLYDQNRKLIHFTSLPILFSIINEGAIRLYNLHNSNDDTEYLYASKKLSEIYKIQKIDDIRISDYINRVKESSFILSCTNDDGLNKPDFWNDYGDSGRGIAIEFEIINDVTKWEYFYCSQILYDKLDSFDRLVSKWREIQNKYNHINYHIRLDQILSLHKSLDWAKESEIRILTLYPDLHEIPFSERVYRDFKLNKVHSQIKYFKLPLCDSEGKFVDKSLEDREEKFWSIIPRVRITDIYFGPDFPITDKLWEFQQELRHYIIDKLNCWILRTPKNKVNFK